MIKVNIELSGNEEDVLSFIGLCAKIQLLGEIGSSTTIPVCVDGDGSANLAFKIVAEVLGKGEVDMVRAWKERYRDSFLKQADSDRVQVHYIGE